VEREVKKDERREQQKIVVMKLKYLSSNIAVLTSVRLLLVDGEKQKVRQL
jgi:hypothetical protein